VREILYSIWIRIDETLPWIELKEEYETKEKAKQAAQMVMGRIAVRLVKLSKERKLAESLVTVRARR
jgi:hypothetical protein